MLKKGLAVLAKAVYDNTASYDSELEFKKDSILTVLEQAPVGLSGWWICNYRGKNGIAPANRLQIIGVLEAPEKPNNLPPKALSGPELPPRGSSQLNSNSVSVIDLYDNTTNLHIQETPDDDNASQRSSGISTSSMSQASNNDYSSTNKIVQSIQKQNKSVRFDDQATYVKPDKVTQSNKSPMVPTHPSSHLSKQNLQSFQKSGTPDNFYDDLNRFDYMNIPSKQTEKHHNQYNKQHHQLPQPPTVASTNIVNDMDTYDQLPDPQALSVDTKNIVIEDLDYDIPQAQQNVMQLQQQPPRSQQPIMSQFDDKLSISSSTRSSQIGSTMINQQQFTREDLNNLLGNMERFHVGADERSVASNTESIDSDDLPYFPDNKINLERDDAVAALKQLDKNFTDRCSYLYKFIHARWKTEASLAMNIAGIKQTVKDIQDLLHEMSNFYCSVSNNSQLESCPDRALSKKIWKHLRVFLKLCDDIEQQVMKLNKMNWTPKLIAAGVDQSGNDSLTLIINCCRDIQIQQRALSTTVHANSKLLFPDNLNLTLTQPKQQTSLQQKEVTPSPDSVHSRISTSSERPGSEIYTRMQSIEKQRFSNSDKETVRFYLDKMRSNADIYDAMCQDLCSAIQAKHPNIVIGALCKNAISRGFKLNQISKLLHDALQNTKMRVQMEANIQQMEHQLKQILRSSKILTDPIEHKDTLSTTECLSRLNKQLFDSVKVSKELVTLVGNVSDTAN